MIRRLHIKSDQRGVGAVEFALIAPVFLGCVFVIVQLGLLFFANAGISSAVAEGARFASLFPRPTNEQIIARINEKRVGLDPAYVRGPAIVSGTAGGASYVDITMSYSAPIDAVFYQLGPITLTKTRRVYTQPAS